ncbi:glycosyltransferase [Ruminiclostridium sufflavum]|nr:glycosyltransferase [Ruminiclostridium sufflavum]
MKGMSNKMNYSVLMSVYKKDNADWLALSIESMLNQTLKPNEIVIIEDGPLTEELNQVLHNFYNEFPSVFKIVALPKNVELGLALRRGILECKNELIARMDSDDISVPVRCEKQIEYMCSHPDIGMVGCIIDEFINETSNVIAHRILPEKHNEIVKFSKRRVPITHPTVMFRKSDVLRCGNYKERYLVEDYDIFVRLLMNGVKAYNIQSPLVYVRVSDDFYKRRGGRRYLTSLLSFNVELYRMGWTSKIDFMVRSIANIVVCFMPNMIRDIIYKKLLRKQVV